MKLFEMQASMTAEDKAKEAIRYLASSEGTDALHRLIILAMCNRKACTEQELTKACNIVQNNWILTLNCLALAVEGKLGMGVDDDDGELYFGPALSEKAQVPA